MRTMRWASMIVALIAWALAAEAADEAPAAQKSALSAELEVPVLSAYVSRGQVNNDEPVVQPMLTVEAGPWRFGTWGNLNLTDRVTEDPDFSEINLWVGYAGTLAGTAWEIGLIEYLFPHTTTEVDSDGDGEPDRADAAAGTREVYLSASRPEAWLVPTLEAYYDVDECGGWYVAGKLEKEIPIVDRVTLTPFFSTGWGSERYNDFYFGYDEAAMNDGNVGVALAYEWSEALGMSLSLDYTWLWDTAVRRAAREEYLDVWSLWGGVAATWRF